MKNKMPKILAIIPTLNDDPTDTINSVLKQTLGVSKILVVVGSKRLYRKLNIKKHGGVEVFYVKPNLVEPIGKRVANALNSALSRVCLEDYDYLLRVDADAVLPSRFIEENLKVDADYIGKAGYAMLIKMKSFIQILNGKFAEVAAEDSYVGLSFLASGRSVKPWNLPPELKRKSGTSHSWQYYFIRGVEMYKLGYEPIHVAETVRYNFKNVLALLGYLTALLGRETRYDFANWVFRVQLRRLVYGKH